MNILIGIIGFIIGIAYNKYISPMVDCICENLMIILEKNKCESLCGYNLIKAEALTEEDLKKSEEVVMGFRKSGN